MAALYAELPSKKTRALVLDGAVDLAEDDFTQRLNQERGFQQSFLRFAAYCGKTDSCQLGGGANQALQRYHALLRKLHEQPFVTAAGYEISADDVLTVTRSLLLWPGAGTSWPPCCASSMPASPGSRFPI
ncbi:alpha/beta fold hydrolase [Serratia ureilytica]